MGQSSSDLYSREINPGVNPSEFCCCSSYFLTVFFFSTPENHVSMIYLSSSIYFELNIYSLGCVVSQLRFKGVSIAIEGLVAPQHVGS